MRPITQTLSSAAAAPWIPINFVQVPVNVSLAGVVDSAANLTWGVQYTASRLNHFLDCSVARSTTTVTVVTRTAHGLVTGDCGIITWADALASRNAGSAITGLDGTYTVTVTDTTTFTYTSTVSGTVATTTLSARVQPLPVFAHEVLNNLTSSAASNFSFPVTACRLNVSSYTAGAVTLTVNQGMGD